MRIVHTYINNMHINIEDESKECFADRWNLPSQAKEGHEVILLCGGNGKSKREYVWKGVKVIELPVLFQINNTTCIIKGFLQELLKSKADIFHAHHYSPLLPELMLITGKLTKKPVFITMHNSFRSENGFKKILEFTYALFMQPFLPFYNKAFFPQDYYLNKGAYFLLPRSRRILCRNMYTYPSNSESRLENKSNRILFLGRLESIKGIDILINAFSLVLKELPEAELHVVGNGTEKHNLMELAENLSIKEKVLFHGALYGNSKWNIMNSSTLLVLPHYDFAESNVFTEAAIRGIPVIVSSPWCVPREVRTDPWIAEKVIFELPDHKDLARKIIYLLKNKDIAKRIGNTLKEVQTPLLVNSGCKMMLREYTKVLKKS